MNQKWASSRNAWTGNVKFNSNIFSGFTLIRVWYVEEKKAKQAQYYVQWQAMTLAVSQL